MNKAFCICGRDHKWDEPPLGSSVICRCGRVLEPQTNQQHRELRQQHRETLRLIVKHLQPTPCLLSSSRDDCDGCMFNL